MAGEEERKKEMIIGREQIIDELALAFHQAIIEYQLKTNRECTVAEIVHAFSNLVFRWGEAHKIKEIRKETQRAAQERMGMPVAPFGSG